jgi:hypothetical protein
MKVDGFKEGTKLDFMNMRAGLILFLTLHEPEGVEYLILDDNELGMGFVIRNKK